MPRVAEAADGGGDLRARSASRRRQRGALAVGDATVLAVGAGVAVTRPLLRQRSTGEARRLL